MFRLVIAAVCLSLVVSCHARMSGDLRQQLLEDRVNKPADTDHHRHTRHVQQSSRSIKIVDDDFVLNNKERLRIVSGSLHYFRTPAVYWRDRLRKFKAAGLNTVSTYVDWSFHEPEERQYRFSGDHDVAQFVRDAAAEGLHVLLRPGPYICAERDLGGLPYWLLGKYPKIRLRTQDKDYMSESKIWLDKLFEQVKPFLYSNGGPIILVQVENEYGSYGNDSVYMRQVRDLISHHVGEAALLYTTDGAYDSYFRPGSVEHALTTIDFGVDSSEMSSIFAPLRRFMPKGPLMNSEFYPGWLTHWGEEFQGRETRAVVDTLKRMLDYDVNVNFYMFYGGTNFEFTAGANWGGTYQPDITSYDYDAPLSEAGDPTPKYYAIRNALEKYFPEVQNIPLPLASTKGAYGKVTLRPSVELLSTQGRTLLGKHYKSITGSALPTFEELRQRSGLVLYETLLNASPKGGSLSDVSLLRILAPRDRVYVFVDGIYKGLLSRMHKIYDIPIDVKANSNVTLSLLVENQGRINYGSMIHDFKGILSPVTFDNTVLQGTWKITGFPLENVDVASKPETNGKSPMFYEGELILPRGEPLDTYLNTDGWGKGYVWVNGHNLGRYWPSEGPQVTLYVPGCWLRAPPAVNRLQILELEAPATDRHIEFIDHPILSKQI